jgi:antibiotic biosynthesis monooxygenase (ABM) superfamily enzyme
MRKQQIAIIALALWLTIVSLFMFLTQGIDLGIFFVLSLIGMLVIVQILQSHYVQPDYQRYIRYLIAAGLVTFGVIVAQKILDIIGWEIIIL